MKVLNIQRFPSKFRSSRIEVFESSDWIQAIR
jgi:hypothetical protein